MRKPSPPPSDENLEEVAKTLGSKNFMSLKPALDKINSQYLHWAQIEVRYHPAEAKELWTYTNFMREINNRAIKIDGLSLRYVQTPLIEKLLHLTDMEIGKRLDILEEQVPSLDLKKKYLISSLMEEAIASSQLEGAVTTRAVAKKMLRERRKPKDKSEQMIVNNYMTMLYIKELINSKATLTLDTIKEIQKRVTKNTLKYRGWEGSFRKDEEEEEFGVYDPYTNERIHKPPHHSKIEPLLTEVISYLNSESMEYYLHPIVKAILLHYLIGYIHPFYDGNGRTARALFYWYMLLQGYDYIEYIAVSSVIKTAPIQYTMAYLYAESDHNDITYFVKFNLNKIRTAITSFNAYIEKKKTENKQVVQTIKYDGRLNLRQADIIITLSRSEKAVNISEMKGRYDVTYETARTDLLDLVKLGYMHKITSGKQYLFILDKEKCVSAMRNATS